MANHGHSDHAHSDHGDYVKGEMDVHQHQATYKFFTDLAKWGSLFIAVFLVFTVLLTCVQGPGLIGAGLAAVVTAVVGFFVLK